MKKNRKIFSFILCITVLISSFGMGVVYTAAESDFVTAAKDAGVNVVDNILAAVSVTLDRGLTLVIDGIFKNFNLAKNGIADVSSYKNPLAEKYAGHDEFADKAADGAVFSLGYDKRSIIPDDFGEATYYKYGAAGLDVAFKYGVNVYRTPADLADYYADEMAAEYGLSQADRDKIAANLRERYAADTLNVRTICLDDSRGKVLIASVDCIGMTNASHTEVAKLIDEYCKANGIDDIVSINVTSTHTHSSIDTLGIMQAVGQIIDGTLITNKLDGTGNTFPNDKFMSFLYKTIADSMISAYENMEKGDLYFAKDDSEVEYTTADGQEKSYNFFTESNDMVDYISEIYKLTFVPYKKSAPKTVIANFAVHPEKVGVNGSEEIMPTVSADFIPYMEQQVQKGYAAEGGCNFIFINSAIGSFIKMSFGSANEMYANTYPDGNDPYVDTTYDGRSYRYGIIIGDYIADIGIGEKVDPILNVRTKDIIVKCDNPVIRILALLKITNNVLLTDSSNGVYTVSNVGYMEIGKHIKIFMCPGEMNPEVIQTADHMLSSKYSITRDSFQYGPLTSYFAEDDEVLCFGLMNDMGGYIDPDNDYSLLVLRLNGWGQEEGKYGFNVNGNAWLFSYSSDTASTLVGNFLGIVDETNGEAPQEVITHDFGRIIPHYMNFVMDIITSILGVFGISK